MASLARLRQKNPDEQQVFSSDDLVVNISRDPEDLEGLLDEDGALTTVNPDGSVVVDFSPPKDGIDLDKGFYKNLADEIEDGELERITSELLSDIDNDIRSREEWLRIRERGIDLLGYKIEDPRGDMGTSSAPLEGMSTVRHPLLSETVLRFQANARGELLPASGPVKVRNDTPPPPEGVEGYYQETEELSHALEIDFNHYLTVTAKEYYPDTDRMLFLVGFGGLGIKKVFNCPLRRRPASDSVDAADLIVSNAATDLQSSGRITHRIKMRPSILKRMQLVGAYRDIPLMLTSPLNAPTPVEKKIGDIQGIRPQTTVTRPDDLEQEIYESYCELDISGHEHKEKGKVSGLRLPYKVSIHVASRKILEVRRNWLKDDPLYMPREYFVDYPFVPAFGFYPLGLVHILGNTTITLTAAWREMIDSGMFSNFPGFIYAKQAGRQLTNQFRVPPGGGVGLDTGGGPLRDAIMPLPYKDIGASFAAFIQHVEEYGMRLGSVSEITIGEGKQEAPVGTTLALIEQATKLMDAVHKRLHAAQAKEFQLLKERFKEDPEAFWRFNKRPSIHWEREQFLAALDNNSVVPVADPNNPTSLHRIAKATAIKQLQQNSPRLYDSMAVDKRIFRIVGVDPEGLFLPEEAPEPPDPRMVAIEEKAETERLRATMQATQAKIKAATSAQSSYDREADRESRERIEQMKIKQEELRIQMEAIIHAFDEEKAQAKIRQDMAMKEKEGNMKLQLSQMQHEQKMKHEQEKAKMDLVSKSMEVQANAKLKAQELQSKAGVSGVAGMDKVQQSRQVHESKLSQQDEAFKQKLTHTEEMHKANLKAAQAQAKLKPKPAAKPKKGK